MARPHMSKKWCEAPRDCECGEGLWECVSTEQSVIDFWQVNHAILSKSDLLRSKYLSASCARPRKPSSRAKETIPSGSRNDRILHISLNNIAGCSLKGHINVEDNFIKTDISKGINALFQAEAKMNENQYEQMRLQYLQTAL